MSIMFSGGPMDGQEQPDPEAPPAEEGESSSGGDPVEILRTILLQLRDYMDAETDEEDIAVAATCLQNIQKLLATNQKQAEALVGGSPATRALAKQTARGGGGGY